MLENDLIAEARAGCLQTLVPWIGGRNEGRAKEAAKHNTKPPMAEEAAGGRTRPPNQKPRPTRQQDHKAKQPSETPTAELQSVVSPLQQLVDSTSTHSKTQQTAEHVRRDT